MTTSLARATLRIVTLNGPGAFSAFAEQPAGCDTRVVGPLGLGSRRVLDVDVLAVEDNSG